MLHGHGVDNQVEAVGGLGHGIGIGRDEQRMRAQGLCVLRLVGRAAEHRDMRAHPDGDLDRHMSQAAETDDAHAAAGAGMPSPQRRIGGDAGAEQRCRTRQIQAWRQPQDELLAHDEVLGIAAQRGLPRGAVEPAIGGDVALAAKLLIALAALVAREATVHHAADADMVTDAMLRHVRADSGDASHDLVAGNGREDRPAPIIAGPMQV